MRRTFETISGTKKARQPVGVTAIHVNPQVSQATAGSVIAARAARKTEAPDSIGGCLLFQRIAVIKNQRVFVAVRSKHGREPLLAQKSPPNAQVGEPAVPGAFHEASTYDKFADRGVGDLRISEIGNVITVDVQASFELCGN